MLALACALILAAPQDVDAENDGPTPEEIAAALTEVRAAFANDDKSVRVEVLTRQRLPAPEVIELVARGLDDREAEVKQAALESLRWTEHAKALEILHRTCRRDKKLRRHGDLGPLLYKAIGQHGSPTSMELLEDKLFTDPLPQNIRTRLLALGRIRVPEAIEVLLDIERSARPGVTGPYRGELRMSLMQLSGIDRGVAFERWRAWWKDSKKDFEMAPKPPQLRRDEQRQWEDFWGLDRTSPRSTRREDRGSDER